MRSFNAIVLKSFSSRNNTITYNSEEATIRALIAFAVVWPSGTARTQEAIDQAVHCPLRAIRNT